MEDVARLVVGGLWCAVALLYLAGGRRRGQVVGATTATVLAGCALLRWHVAALHAARSLLRGGGVYDGRAAFKAAIGAAVVAAWVVLALRSRREGPAVPAVASLATFGGLAYLAMQTAFLDDVMPEVLAHGVGRYALEGAFALVAAVALLAPRSQPRAAGAR